MYSYRFIHIVVNLSHVVASKLGRRSLRPSYIRYYSFLRSLFTHETITIVGIIRSSIFFEIFIPNFLSLIRGAVETVGAQSVWDRQPEAALLWFAVHAQLSTARHGGS